MTDIEKINQAWQEEGSIGRLGMKPAADKAIQAALIPAGGDWRCVAEEGAITRSIVWARLEVALINPRGDMNDSLEGDIAMGVRATPVMDKALRAISILAMGAENLDLIRKIARAAIDYVEQPAPRIPDPDGEEFEEDEES